VLTLRKKPITYESYTFPDAMAGEMKCIRLCSMSLRDLTPAQAEFSLISLESFLLPKLGNLGLILAERFPEIGKVYF
jgi:hypothetical protein